MVSEHIETTVFNEGAETLDSLEDGAEFPVVITEHGFRLVELKKDEDDSVGSVCRY